MKVLVRMVYEDYEGGYPSGDGFLVPDDFDPVQARQQWNEETQIPYVGRNQYGEWKSTKYANHSVTFDQWLREKYEKIDVIEFE